MKLYTQAEAAEKFCLSRRSLIRYEADGLITPVRTPGGQRRYPESELLRLYGLEAKAKQEGVKVTLGQLIERYYDARGLKRPSEWEALAWAITELGEAYEHLLAREGGWVRNSPESHPEVWDPSAFAEELGDAIMMLVMAGRVLGVDPLSALRRKLVTRIYKEK